MINASCNDKHNWALVLAAGEGRRLRDLITSAFGVSAPKQFCSLYGGSTLLEASLDRGRAVVAGARVCTVVASEHRTFWEPDLRNLLHDNVFVQPANKGTAVGILMPLLHIMLRDPDARIVLLPSDHYVNDELSLAASIQHALEFLRMRHGIILLGMTPDEPDDELGYIVPGVRDNGRIFRVERFVEKPSIADALRLMDAGAQWNSFMVAASGRALIELYATNATGGTRLRPSASIGI